MRDIDEQKRARQDAYHDAIADRTQQLLKDDFAPFQSNNIAEAMSHVEEDELSYLSRYLNASDYANAGKTLSKILNHYWQNRAMTQAKKECTLC